jgi:hypothetical protein
MGIGSIDSLAMQAHGGVKGKVRAKVGGMEQGSQACGQRCVKEEAGAAVACVA